MADKKTRAQILGENLKRIRLEKGITRKQLAEKIGITEISFGKYERGESLAPLDKIFEIADFLQVSVASLTGENDFSDEVPNVEKIVEERILQYRLITNVEERILQYRLITKSMYEAAKKVVEIYEYENRCRTNAGTIGAD